MELERAGIPALMICSDKFEKMGRSLAGTLGRKDLDIGVILHPVGGIPPHELERRCQAAYEQARAWVQQVVKAPVGAVGEG